MAFSSVLTDYLGEGTIAARPATLDIAPTALGFFYAKDTDALSLWNGTTWIAVGAGSGSVVEVVAGAGLAGGTITASGTISLGTIAAGELLGNVGTVAGVPAGIAIGAGLSLSPTGTISATGTTGVTEVVISSSAFLNAGTIVGTGTISSPPLAAQSLIGNPSTIGAQAVAVPLGPGFSFASGTLEFAGTVASGVTSVVAGFGLTGGTITGAGTLALEASQSIRTVPFPMIGTVAGAQEMNITFTQAGTLLANGGAPQAFVGTNPTATERLTLNTIHSGALITQGTVTISTAGAVTFPTFSAVAITAGDTAQLLNQATADATFGNTCLSLQFQVT